MKKLLMSVLVLFFLGAGVAHAQGISCVLRNELVKHLSDKFEEVQAAAGLADNGGLFEIFAAPSGTWTAVITMPDGVSCLVATGESFETLRPKVKEKPSDPT